MSLQAEFAGGLLYLWAPSELNTKCRQAGFNWRKEIQAWVTPFSTVAARVLPPKNTALEYLRLYEDDCFNTSALTTAPRSYRAPSGLEYRPYQNAAIGLMLGREAILLSDPMGCISGDALIKCNRAKCSREISLRDLYGRFHGIEGRWREDFKTRVTSMADDGGLVLEDIKDVIYKGFQKVFRIVCEVKGGKLYNLDATRDHELYSGGDWTQLKDLKVGNYVAVNGIEYCPICKEETEVVSNIYAKFYGHCKKCVFRWKRNIGSGARFIDKDGYARLSKGLLNHPRHGSGGIYEHILAYEAFRNGLSLKTWINKIKTNSFEGHWFVPADMHIHHVDGNENNNAIKNLRLMTCAEHSVVHKKVKNIKHMSIAYARVKSIKCSGQMDVYDISTVGPNHNFVANGIVVHNCGKTMEVAGLINETRPSNVLVVCPASVKLNWARELEKWLLQRPIDIHVVYSKVCEPGHRFYIINYDIVYKHADFLKSQTWDLLVLDEAHYLKNKKARRTMEVFGGRKRLKTGEISTKTEPIRASKTIALTGTPIENRPIEFYPMLHYLLPDGFPTISAFEKRYCDLKLVHGRWDNSGASNLDELQRKLRSSIMIRRSKEEVLKDLPPKSRQVIELEVIDGKLAKAIKALNTYPGMDGFKKSIRSLRFFGEFGNDAIATIRRETGIAKLPLVIDHLEGAIEESGKVICFCYHKAVVEGLVSHFGKACVSLTGATALKQRQKNIDAFQSDPGVKLFVGNIDAAGIGITLTAASHVVFAEMSWVISKNLQAEDRAHRIGQTDNVLVQYLVWADSIDAYVANTVVDKADTLEAALDNEFLL